VDAHPEQVLLDVGFYQGHGRSSFPETSERSKLGPQGLADFRTPRSRGSSVRRYYDPQTGQFISVDPAVDQTEAPYAYVDGDPVDSTDPLGLGCSVLATFNPFSSNNCINAWAAGGSLAANIVLKSNPAFLAVSGYANEAQAYENGCSLWTVAMYGAEGAAGVVATGTTAFGGAAVVGRLLDEGETLATPAGRVYSAHYLNDTGPVRNIPGSVVDETISHGQIAEKLGDRTVFYDAKNDVTVVQSNTTGKILSVRRGAP
jgi:uncharacterized protein RhaS with RHS repeats